MEGTHLLELAEEDLNGRNGWAGAGTVQDRGNLAMRIVAVVEVEGEMS